MWLWIVVLLVVALLAYVRLAPTDVAAVHAGVDADDDVDGEGHCVRVLSAEEGVFERIDFAMRGLERTQVVAGSVAEGKITYVTRSKWIGFPDYTTIEQGDGQVKMFARLRFGRSDFNVNRARLEHVKRVALS